MKFDIQLIVAKVIAAESGQRGALSTGEALIAALVLDRPDWLEDMGYTIAQAIDRIGPDWAAAIPRIVHALAMQQAELSSRFTYEILPNPEHEGGGYRLRLLDSGQEVGSGLFPERGQSAAYIHTNTAYAETVAAAHAWLDTHITPTQTLPRL